MGLRILRNLDLVVLALALPVFIAAELPLLGWAAATVAWLASRVVQPSPSAAPPPPATGGSPWAPAPRR